LRKLANTSIEKAVKHITQAGNSYQKYINDIGKENYIRFVTSNSLEKGGNQERIMISIKLALWSCVSKECHNYTSITLLNFRGKGVDLERIDVNKIWCWLSCFTSCVLCTSVSVYEMYGTSSLLKKNPICQVLFLVSSIYHNCVIFVKVGTKLCTSDLGIDMSRIQPKNDLWRTVTLSFLTFVEGNVQATIRDITKSTTLTFFWMS
jgi:hypothetical protein